LTFRYELSRRAESYFDRLERARQRMVVEKLREICDDPHGRAVSKPLQGRRDGLRTSQVLNLRILFYVRDEIEVVDVTDIGPRGDIYKGT
jgi:mRNA-degrading endonuclease RelE of RelBE toxin-antitoxin system